MLTIIREHETLAKCIPLFNELITKAIYLAYPCLLAYLLIAQIANSRSLQDILRSELIPAFIIPLVSFLILSIFRKIINAPRPYEVFKEQPIIAKDTKGKSFPSRHVFSIFAIATTFFFAAPQPELSYIIFILGCLLGVLRVVSGVHFPKDVIIGAISGIVLVTIGFIAW